MSLRLTFAQQDRACGVLLGAAVGDALGAGYEFGAARVGDGPPRMIGGGLGDFEPGEWTDDTAMTWAVADVAATGADLRTEEALDAIALRFREWYDGRPPDIGINTLAVLSAAGPRPTGATLAQAARSRHEATGRTGSNGSLMRTSPVALAHLDDPDALVEAAYRVGALTHPDPHAQEACALWCLAIRHAVLTGELDLRAGVDRLPDDSRATWLERIEAAETRPPDTFSPNGGAVVALQAAWSAIVQTPVPATGFACKHLADALETAIRIGHDTDTVASIAGALLGARWGMSAIPAIWRRVLHGYPGITGRRLEELAILAAQGGRPGKYGWPLVDHIDYLPLQYGRTPLVRHPHDDGVWLAGAPALDDLPAAVDAVVTLCLVGRTQVPTDLEHVTFRLIDDPDPDANPNLDFVLVDAARTIAELRDEGKVVLLHCVAAHSRTPAVATAYAVLRGVPASDALAAVRRALPTAQPNVGFVEALGRMELTDHGPR